MSTTISPQLRNLMNCQSDLWGCKDLESNYLHANQAFCSTLGLSYKKGVEGLTDLDLPCDAVQSADCFRAQDREVIASGERLRILDIHRFADKQWHVFLCSKTPLRDKNRHTIGTVFHSKEIDTRETIELGRLLSRIAQCEQGSDWLTTETSFTLGYRGQGPRLTRRQEEVLFFLLHGRSARQIALALGMAPRTAEWHERVLKDKFSAASKSELIDRAIEQGFLHSLPPGLCRRELSIILRED